MTSDKKNISTPSHEEIQVGFLSTSQQTNLHHPTIPLPLIGGIIFLVLVFWSYSNLNDDFYQVRNDDVITMSHTKNWVDYGFIGVAPSGEPVEGYSTPVQFFIYAIAYRLTEISYDTFAMAQTIIATFLLGAIFILFFWEDRTYAFRLAPLCLPTFTAHIISTMAWLWHGKSHYPCCVSGHRLPFIFMRLYRSHQ